MEPFVCVLLSRPMNVDDANVDILLHRSVSIISVIWVISQNL